MEFYLSNVQSLGRTEACYKPVSETDSMQHIHDQRWTLMEDILSVLRPFEELTREMSAENACISTVLPAVMTLKRFIHNETDNRGIKQMETRMLTSLQDRFEGLEGNAVLVVATSLDPRYKTKFWLNDTQQCRSKLLVQEAVALISESDISERPTTSEQAETQGPRDRTKNDAVQESGATGTNCSATTPSVSQSHRALKQRSVLFSASL